MNLSIFENFLELNDARYLSKHPDCSSRDDIRGKTVSLPWNAWNTDAYRHRIVCCPISGAKYIINDKTVWYKPFYAKDPRDWVHREQDGRVIRMD